MWILRVCSTASPRHRSASRGSPRPTGFRQRASTPTDGHSRWTTSGCNGSTTGVDTPHACQGADARPPAAPGLPAPPTAERCPAVDDQPDDVLRRPRGCRLPPGAVVVQPARRHRAARACGRRAPPGQGRSMRYETSWKDYVAGARRREASRRCRRAAHPTADGDRLDGVRPDADVAPPSRDGGRGRATTARSRSTIGRPHRSDGARRSETCTTSRSRRRTSYVANGLLVHNSVYRFRGADFRNILQFEEAFPEVTTVVLDQNYRSTQTILDAANAVIANNAARKPKNLWTDAGSGHRIVRYHAEDEGDEATFVASTARQLHDDHASNWRELAVLYRTNAQSRVVEEAMMRLGVPYKVVGGTRFYDRREIKDAMAYLRAVVNPADEVSVKRVLNVPKRGVGDASIAKLDALAAAEGIGFVEALRRADDAGVTGPARARHRVVRRPARRARARWSATTARRPRRPAAGGARPLRLPRRAGGRGHRRVGRAPREPRRARRLGPRVHRARRVPRAGRRSSPTPTRSPTTTRSC